jgi:hypothetical protein
VGGASWGAPFSSGRGHRVIGLDASAALALSTSGIRADVDGKLQAGLAGLSDSAKALVLQHSGVDLNSPQASQAAGTIATGAALAADIGKNGLDLSKPEDQQKVFHAMLAGIALIVPVGTAFAAFAEVGYALGKVMACPLTHLFGGTSPECGDPPCTTSHGWTAKIVLDGSGLPAYPKGSFGELATGMLALNAANQDNCLDHLTPDHVVDGAVNVYNMTHAGPAVDVYVPPLATLAPPLVHSGQGLGVNVPLDTRADAFKPLSQCGWLVQNWARTGYMMTEGGALTGGAIRARTVRVNAGALLPPPPTVVTPTRVVSLRTGPAPVTPTRVVTLHQGTPGTPPVIHPAPAAVQKMTPVVVQPAPGAPPVVMLPVIEPAPGAPPVVAPMPPPHAVAQPGSPGAPPGASVWHCTPDPRGAYDCRWI